MRRGGRDSMSREHLLMISGWGHGKGVFNNLVPCFISRHDVTITSPVELLQGGRDKCDPSETVSPYAHTLREQCNTFQNPGILIGWSMGAMLALEAAARLDLKARAIILIAGTARFCAAGDYQAGVAAPNLRAMKRGLKNDPETTLHTFFANVAAPRRENEEIIGKRVERALSFGAEALVHGLQFLLEKDLRESLAQITAPVLIIHGGQDTVIPVSAGQFLHREISQSSFVELSDGGHDIVVTHANEIAEKIGTFVANGNSNS